MEPHLSFGAKHELPREVIRLNADGTSWVAPDITDDEIRKVLPDLVRVAATAHKTRLDCESQHQS